MFYSVKVADTTELKRSFYLLTEKLTEIEATFNGKIEAQINEELNQHQQFVLSTCKYLDHLEQNSL